MNFSSIVGPVDVFSASVLIAIMIGVTIMVSTALARTSVRKLEMDLELAKYKIESDTKLSSQANDINREKALATISVNKEIEFKRIDHGMVDVKAATKKSSQYDGGDN